jgi:lipoprotein-anchoring transpeptidase ErfK/SrfK
MNFLRYLILSVTTALLCSHCSGPSSSNGLQQEPYKALHVNPFSPGNYHHFRAQKGYPRNYDIWKNKKVLARTNESNSSIRIDLSEQRGYLMNDTQLAMDYPVATGRSAFPTPPGKYMVLEKIESGKRSATYGKIYDAEGECINADADSRKDIVPPGGKYVGA